MEYVVPIFIIIILAASFIRGVPAYNKFTDGAMSGLKFAASVFPFLAAIFLFIALLRESGISNFLTTVMSPVLTPIGVPPELTEMIVLRPFSGSGSIALLNNLMKTHGADSYIARTAAVIMAASETVFYVAALYFSTVKIKKLRGVIPISLIATFVGALVACWLCRII